MEFNTDLDSCHVDEDDGLFVDAEEGDYGSIADGGSNASGNGSNNSSNGEHDNNSSNNSSSGSLDGSCKSNSSSSYSMVYSRKTNDTTNTANTPNVYSSGCCNGSNNRNNNYACSSSSSRFDDKLSSRSIWSEDDVVSSDPGVNAFYNKKDRRWAETDDDDSDDDYCDDGDDKSSTFVADEFISNSIDGRGSVSNHYNKTTNKRKRGSRASQHHTTATADSTDGSAACPSASYDNDTNNDGFSSSCSIRDARGAPAIEKSEALAASLRIEGNELYKNKEYESAIYTYTRALSHTPRNEEKLKAIILSNRAACHQQFGNYEAVIADCSEAVKYDPGFSKAYFRRFRANEAQKKWHDALADINKAFELDPALKTEHVAAQRRVERESKEQFEKEKAEMMGKMKDFGNFLLGKVGLSTDNFKMEQNENGSYNIQFQPNKADDGSSSKFSTEKTSDGRTSFSFKS